MRISRVLIAVAAAGLGLVSSYAKAASITDMIVGGSPAILNSGEDQSRERFVAGPNHTVGNPFVQAGDFLEAFFRVDAINGNAPENTVSKEWTGVVRLMVQQVAIAPGGANYTEVTFAPDPNWNWKKVSGGANPEAAVIAMYEDVALNFKFQNPATADNGTFYWAMGFGPGSYFNARSQIAFGPPANIPLNVGSLFGTNDRIALAEFALDLVAFNPIVATKAPQVQPHTEVLTFGVPLTGDFVGYSYITGQKDQVNPTPGWDLKDNLNVTFAVAPTPAAIWGGVMLLGGLGAAYGIRRRNQA